MNNLNTHSPASPCEDYVTEIFTMLRQYRRFDA